ncbi:MAG: dolichyl-phosphate beta-D-mannosyltransferase [Bdellovibrionaceae bacterium]|nr:dolichyl-phosphate beta-D-mannosyltransferase [Pseudobdellovibrionaceae bacterium]|tara:strand:+ start:559 stop:1293 length:735 start_codon:yes stop_codon:yes gene_type:complete
MRSLVIIPTYNEAENIKPIVTEILSLTPEDLHILIADDRSPDGTGALADQLSAQNSRVHVLHREKKEGLGRAYIAGFRWGLSKGYDVLIEMDADFSHNPKYLKDMLEALKTHDVAIGSRYVPGGGTVHWGLGRKILSRGGSFYARMILGAPIRDFTGGFNGWHREVLESLGLESLESDGYSFQIELKFRAFRLGFRIKEFPIIFEDRQVGQSKMNKKIVIEALMKIWRFRMGASQIQPRVLPRS